MKDPKKLTAALMFAATFCIGGFNAVEMGNVAELISLLAPIATGFLAGLFMRQPGATPDAAK